ncbi:MAG: hypothetical protein AAF492_06290 [Verrucomicrobiota bacterium]
MKTGTWLTVHRYSAFGVMALLLAGCVPPSKDKAPETISEEKPVNPSLVDIPSTVRNNLGITFADVERRQVSDTLRVPGVFELQPTARKEYRISLAGQVDLAVNQYDQVKKGQLLYRYRSRAWPELQHEIIEAERNMLAARAELLVTRARHEDTEKQLKLFKQRLESLGSTTSKEADLEADIAKLETDRPRLEADIERADTRVRKARSTREHAQHRLSALSDLSDGDLTVIDEGEHRYRLSLTERTDLTPDRHDKANKDQRVARVKFTAWPELQQEVIAAEQNVLAAEAELAVARGQQEKIDKQLSPLHRELEALAAAESEKARLVNDIARLATDHPRLEARIELAESRLENARLTRQHALHKISALTHIPERDLMVMKNGEPAYLTIEWIEVRAKEAGMVESLAVADGAYAEPPTRIMSVVDPTRLRFRAMALQSDLPALSDGAEAWIVPPRGPGIDINESVPTTVSIGLEAHTEQRTVPLLATPDEVRSWIRPGISAFLEVVTDTTGGPALAIPRSAVVKDGIVHVFFKRNPQNPNQALRIEADLGVDDGRWVALNSGVGPKDEVVLDGAFELKLATSQSGKLQKGGHFHADGTFHAEDH